MSTTDALAALKIWALDVEVGGETFRIPAHPAVDWFLAILAEDEPLPIVPGMMGVEEQERISDMLLDDEVGTDELVKLSREVLTEAAGRSWWEADRLIRSSAAEWQVIGGELTRLGVDLSKVSLAAALNAIYVICVRTMDEKERNKFDIDLRVPPIGVEGVTTEEMYDARKAEDAFMALMGGSLPPAPVES